MNEIWKQIADYDGYFISSLGRVKSTKQWNGSSERILKQGISKKGYSVVVLSKNNNTKTFLVHRLVAFAFIPNPQNFNQINHINEIKTDNRVENLEWCTNSYNMSYGSRLLKQIQKCSKPVLCVETDVVYPSEIDAARKNNLNQGNISNCCNGRNKTCGGFHWRYV